MPSLYELSAYSYQKEIEELKSDFEIISFEKFTGEGATFWNEPKTMRIVFEKSIQC